MEKIFHKKKLIALKIKSLDAGSNSVTNPEEPLQLVTLRHKKGASVKPHTHTPTRRVTLALQECLVVLKGKIRVHLYGSDKKPFRSVTVKEGEAFVTISGGHSIDFMEDSQIIEVKNGPYKDDRVAL